MTAGLLFPPLLSAQSSPWIRAGAHGVLLATYADPVPDDRSLAELRLVQPMLMAHAGALYNRVRFVGSVNLEGLTLPNGELTPGAWGEGFIDRRHPHTHVHELMLTGTERISDQSGGIEASVSVGKGFVPFGTDDPMVRPVVRYPVNHHLAQILERATLIGEVRAGPVGLEAALFNGDEPEHPGQGPNLSRFGDSWSGRITVLPLRMLELQGSYADVHSPEHRLGSGTDQQKWSLSARWDGPVQGKPLYGLVEWARTSEAEGTFVFHSFLAEGAWTTGPSRLHYRFERTERPEEERTLDPFRSVRPPVENSIQGITRWTIHTAGYGYRMGVPEARFTAMPFLELSYGRMHSVGGGVFDVETFYGKTSFWSISVGLRMDMGMIMHRMGRYGASEDRATSGPTKGHGHE